MKVVKKIVKDCLRRINHLSPYPAFYPFIMSKNEKLIFDSAVKTATGYLEFGLGGSTLRVLQKSNATIYSVESSQEWIDEMRKYLVVRNSTNKKLFIHHVDIGPTKKWGYPESEANKELFPAYSSNIFDDIDVSKIDLVLVDGRFRVACALMAILNCQGNENFNLLFHDFWTRPDYQVVLKYLDVKDRADSIGLFTIRANVDLSMVKNDYEKYKYKPE